MKFDLYNQQGEVTGSVTLPKEIFELEFNADLVHQVAVGLMANKRQISAHAKIRSEVRGGGKKPWKQKGTGRARVGSNRSPLWRKGGVSFGPKPRDYSYNLMPKVRKLAIKVALSEKVRAEKAIVIEKLETKKLKTQDMAALLIITGGPGTGKSTITKAILSIAEKAEIDKCTAGRGRYNERAKKGSFKY